MKLHMQSTIFGQFARWVSRNGMFKYPDEIDPSLWKSAVQQIPSRKLQQPQQPQEPERTNGHIEGSKIGTQKGDVLNADVEKNEQSVPPRDSPEDVLVVGWYGPDDPEASDYAVPNMTLNSVLVPDMLESRTESTELAQQLKTPHRFADVHSKLCRVHRKFDLRTRRAEPHGGFRRRRGGCNAGALAFHLVRDASYSVPAVRLSC